MLTGRVKWYDPEQGIGYIRPDEGSEDLFVHQVDILGERNLRDDERVVFEAEEGLPGLKAVRVHSADGT